jgi:hypothetical protein
MSSNIADAMSSNRCDKLVSYDRTKDIVSGTKSSGFLHANDFGESAVALVDCQLQLWKNYAAASCLPQAFPEPCR